MRRLGGVLSVNKSSTVRNALSVYLLVDSLFANRKYRKIRHGLKEWHASDSHSLVLVYGWSAIRKLVRDGVFEKSVEEIVVRKLVVAEKTTLSSSY
jgi:hypothetical protein